MYCTSQNVIDLTGVTPADLGLDEQADPNLALNGVLNNWIMNISNAIDVRLIQGEVDETDPFYNGIADVCVRTVAKLVAVARQNRISPIMQIGEFAVNILNTAQVVQDLATELRPYQKRSVQFFSSYTPHRPQTIWGNSAPDIFKDTIFYLD